LKIEKVLAREILDSRGKPTVAASVLLTDGVVAEACVPSGASTGKTESVELRDGGTRFGGQGVLGAVKNVEMIIGPALIGMDAKDQAGIDKVICGLDGTENKRCLGANATLAVSLAVARAQALSDELELFEYLSVKFRGSFGKNYVMPTPMFNVLNGGKHAANNVDIQEAMIVPVGFKKFTDKLRAGSEIYSALRTRLDRDGYQTGLGDEGGFAPNLDKNEEIFKYLGTAIIDAGYSPKKVRISLDVAADSFYNPKTKSYRLEGGHKDFSTPQFIRLISGWVKKYHLLSVEDGLYEADPKWGDLTKAISPAFSIGDDLFTTHAAKIKVGGDSKIANGVIIKPNQVGTLTETFQAVKAAQRAGFRVVVSHRSGETEDAFIADLAVAVGADYIKSGAPARSERLAKYNRLLKIEELLLSDNRN
jgi:enolase